MQVYDGKPTDLNAKTSITMIIYGCHNKYNVVVFHISVCFLMLKCTETEKHNKGEITIS